MSLRFEVHLGPLPSPSGRPADPSRPFRILVLGDFAGRKPGVDRAPLTARRPTALDAETLDRVLARIEPGVLVGTRHEVVRFRKMADFHPEALCDAVPELRRMCDTHRRLSDPMTFEPALRELREAGLAGPEPGENEAEAEQAHRDESGAETLERLLGGRPPEAPKPTAPAALDLSGFIHRLIAPHLEPGAPAHQPEMIALFERGMEEALRRVLHDPRFQALEATWRGVEWLVRGLEIDEQIRCDLLDVSRDELIVDVGGRKEVGDSDLFRNLAPEGDRTVWSAIVGQFEFGDSAADCALLQGLGRLAAHLGAPFLAAAEPSVLGCGSLGKAPRASDWHAREPAAIERWQALRSSPAAAWIGLSMPRFLLRMPYGQATAALERFRFEEQSEHPEHDVYLWGNPALAWARLLGQGFLDHGWGFDPSRCREVTDLPVHAYQEDGEWRMQAVAEVTLPDGSTQAILDAGLMPLCSRLGTNSALFPRFLSLADPPVALLGPW